MSEGLKKHHRRSMRLQGYDYAAAGAYVVTLVAHGRARVFGEVVDDVMMLNEMGRVAEAEWIRGAELRREIELDAFVIMPNHIHGIVLIMDDVPNAGASNADIPTTGAPTVGATGGRPAYDEVETTHGQFPVAAHGSIGHHGRGDRSPAAGASPLRSGPRPRSLGALVAGHKAAVTSRFNEIPGVLGEPLWQRNYHDRIVRDERELIAFRKYIEDNPMQWALDRENKSHA